MEKCLSYICCCFWPKLKEERNQILSIKPKTSESDGNTYHKEYEPQKRQSFNEHICDDLCEVILQYLSLKDKFRLQCVSNQFQRTIFSYQRRIIIGGFYVDYQMEAFDCINILKFFIYTKEFDFKSFELLLKKCRNIKSIRFGAIFLSEANRNQIIQLILKYCNNLTQFISIQSMINANNFEEFKRKYCQSLKFFKDKSCVRDNTQKHLDYYRIFPNIEKLTLLKLEHEVLNLKLERIKSLTVYISQGEEELATNIIMNFRSVRRLTLVLVNSSDSLLSSMDVFIKDMPKLKHLIDLRISNYVWNGIINQEIFYGFLINIVQNCNQLKSFEIRKIITSNNSSNIKELLEVLKGIKRLDISFKNNIQYNSIANIKILFALKEWKQLSNISHLILMFEDFPPFNEILLNEILKTLINVRHLRIICEFKADEGSTQLADILSRLSRLERIYFKIENELICNQIKAKLIEKCKKIRIIDIEVKKLNE